MAGNPNLTPQDFLSNMNQILGSSTGPKLIPNNPNADVNNVPDNLFGGAPSPSSGGSFWGDFGKGMLGTGKSLLDGLNGALGTVGNVFNSSNALWNDLVKGAGDISNKVGNGGTPAWSDFSNIGSNIGSDLSKIWSNPTDANAGGDITKQAFNNAYGNTPDQFFHLPQGTMANVQEYGMPFADPIANPLIGKAASLAGKGLMEGIGRIPGVENWADARLTQQAPSVYRQAASDALAPKVDMEPLSLPQANPEVRQLDQALLPEAKSPLKLQPISPDVYSHPFDYIPPAALKDATKAPLNSVEGIFSEIPKATSEIPSNLLSSLGKTENTIPTEEELANVLKGENTNQGMSPGDKLSAALGNVLKTTVGDRVNRALFRAGIGSGLNLLPEDIRNAYLNNRAAFKNNNDTLNNHFLDMAKEWASKGITHDDLRTMRNAFEAGQTVDPKMQPILDQLTKANNEGVGGVEAGLNAEQAHHLNDGMAMLDNYLHLSMDPQGFFDRMFKGDKANNITSHYGKKREFATAANAEAAGYKVRDPIASTLDRLRESNRDISNTKLYKELFELAKKNPNVMSLDRRPGFTQFQSVVRNNPFHGMFLNPQMSRLLNEVERVPASAKAGFMGSFLRGWDGMTNVYRATNLYNPMIHNHNTFGNALVAYGLNPEHYANAEATLGSSLGKKLGGEITPDMQKSLAWAEKTGALGSDMHPDTLKEIAKTLQGKGMVGKAKDAYQKFQQEGLWNREKALRLGVFHQAFQDALSKGLKEADAAHVARDVTNEHMVDYSSNNLSPLEKELFSRLDPFYKWHKGNYPLQTKKSFTDPSAMLRQVKANGLFNGLNTALSGHPMAQNLGGDKEKHTNLEIPIGNGQVMSTDRYMPWDETQKMLGESLPSFLYNRLNPLLREGTDQLSNKQFYPSSALAPEGKSHLAQYPITLDTDNFGTAAGLRAHHAASAIAPNWLKNLEDVLKPNGNSAGFDLAKMGLGALGTFPKQNPVSPTTLQRSKAAEERYLKDQKRQAKTRDKRGN